MTKTRPNSRIELTVTLNGVEHYGTHPMGRDRLKSEDLMEAVRDLLSDLPDGKPGEVLEIRDADGRDRGTLVSRDGLWEYENPVPKVGRPPGGSNRRRGGVSLFGHGAAAVGLTHDELATYLGISTATVRAYALGTRTAKPAVLEAMATLWEQVSMRTSPTKPIPDAAMARRAALQALRSRDWSIKIDPDDGDDEEEDDDE